MKSINLSKQKEIDIFVCYNDPYCKGPTLLINNLRICLNYNQFDKLCKIMNKFNEKA